MSYANTLDLAADIIYTADIIARIETLEAEDDPVVYVDDIIARAELRDLVKLMRDLKGTGGDEQWRGDWYPSHLIADRHFVDYAREMLEDCGTIPRDLPAWVEIDWRATARNVQMDYTSVDVDGRTFWTR